MNCYTVKEFIDVLSKYDPGLFVLFDVTDGEEGLDTVWSIEEWLKVFILRIKLSKSDTAKRAEVKATKDET